jgi:hypothetical protein
MKHQRASTFTISIVQASGVAPWVRNAFLHFAVCSETCMWIGIAGSSSVAPSTSSVSSNASTARTEWGATPKRNSGLGR